MYLLKHAKEAPRIFLAAWAKPIFIVLLILFVLYNYLGSSGYGNDIDSRLMVRSGQNLLIHQGYVYSRPPGYLVPEVIIGGASLLGGHLFANFISASLGIASLYLFWQLLTKRFTDFYAVLLAAIVGLSPYFVIAASSALDYLYSIFFGLLAIVALTARRPFIAAPLFALAISSRLSNLLIITVIYLFYFYTQHQKRDYVQLRQLLISIGLAGCLTTLLFVPSYLAAENSFAFLTYSIGEWNIFGYLSRFIYKNIYLLGLLPFLYLAATTSWYLLKRKLEHKFSPELKVGLLILLVQELLFFKVPLEISYLLPILFIAIPIWVMVLKPKKRYLVILLALVISYSFLFNLDILNRQYNETGTEAVGASVGFYFRPGVVIADVEERVNRLHR